MGHGENIIYPLSFYLLLLIYKNNIIGSMENTILESHLYSYQPNTKAVTPVCATLRMDVQRLQSKLRKQRPGAGARGPRLPVSTRRSPRAQTRAFCGEHRATSVLRED